jgi:GT2 family glycosyltransferase
MTGAIPGPRASANASIEVTICVVNTEQRELLVRGLDAIAREREGLPFATEVLVLDNASQDRSIEAAEHHKTVDKVIPLDRRTGKSENDSLLLQNANGKFCFLLNEDSELLPGSTLALYSAITDLPNAGAVGSTLLRPDLQPYPSAWKFPSPLSALSQAFFLHKRFVVQSHGTEIRKVDWAQSAALLVRRDAAAGIGWLDPDFFVYSDEVDFCKRLRKKGWLTYFVPEAKAIHHEQLCTGSVPNRRIIEMNRNRDLYMHKHHSALSALTVRLLNAWTYGVRGLVALVRPGHNHRRYFRHVHASLFPNSGEGLREQAERHNRALAVSESVGVQEEAVSHPS